MAVELSKVEADVVKEINLARTNPRAYAAKLVALRDLYVAMAPNDTKARLLRQPGRPAVLTDEGVAAVDEAIEFLRRVAPVPAIGRISPGLCRAARDHVADLGATGKVSHYGSDGSPPASRVERYGRWRSTASGSSNGVVAENISYGGDTGERFVVKWITDDGVVSRSHRATLFNDEFEVLGVGVGSHSVFRTVCVTEFASSFTDFEGSGWDPANQPDRLPDRLASVTDDVVRCEGCANTIEGQGTRLDDGTQWHMGCLVCCDCERRLNGDFYERDGRWYCEACFRAVYLATMAADRAAAMEGAASGGGRGSGADPAPPAHICSVCSEPADDDGQRILLFGRKWHGACFACEVCQGQLSVDNARLIGDRVLCAPCSERPENVVGASSEIVFVDSANGLELSADTNLSVEKEGAVTGATFGSQPGGRFQPTVGGRDPHAAPQASIFSIPPPGSTAARDRHLLNTDLTLSSPPLGSSSLGPPGRRSDRFLSGSPAAERGLGGSRLSAFGGATTGYASLGTFRSNLGRRSPPLGSTANLGDFKTGPWSASVFDRGSTVSGGLSWDTAGDQRDRQGSSAVGSEASMSTGSPARQRTNTLGWGGSLGGSLGGLGVMTAPRPPHDTLSASSARFSLGGLGSPMHSHVRARASPPSDTPRQFGRFHTTRRNDWTSRPGQSPTRPSSPMIYRPMPGGIFGPIPHPSLDSPAQEGQRSPVRFASSPPERVFDNSARPSPARPAAAEGNRLAVAAPEPRPVTSGGFQSLSGSLVTLKQRRPIVLTTASSPERTAPPPRPRGGPVAGEVIETVETYFGDGTQRGFFAQLQDDSALNGPRSPARRLRLDVRSDDRYAPRLSDLVRF